MSQQSEKTNLLKNGDFSEAGLHWKATDAKKVKYQDGHCALQTPGSINREISIQGGGSFRFSAKMRTDPRAYGRVRLLIEPSWSIIELNLRNSDDWTFAYTDFSVGSDATSFKIKLEAADGSLETFGVYVDDVVLERR
jgi:hypothetical protein